LWDTATGTRLRRWEVSGDTSARAFTPDGRALATAAEDGVSVWDLETGTRRFHSPGPATLVRPSPDGRVLAASAGPAIRLLDLRTGKEFDRLKGHEADVAALGFTHDGKALVSGSADSTALVWGAARLVPPGPKVVEQSTNRLDEVWAELASEDASK